MDFHAEATSEKRALGFYLDGKDPPCSERTPMFRWRMIRY
ncbi:MAG: YmdB family metallophosphoesterase [Oscillospiraceae bacterium]